MESQSDVDWTATCTVGDARNLNLYKGDEAKVKA